MQNVTVRVLKTEAALNLAEWIDLRDSVKHNSIKLLWPEMKMEFTIAMVWTYLWIAFMKIWPVLQTDLMNK